MTAIFRHHLQSYKPIVRWAWLIHLTTSVIVLMYGVNKNKNNSKYIPGDTSSGMENCMKSFLNVHATDASDGRALICCNESKKDMEDIYMNMDTGVVGHLYYENGLCQKMSNSFPFSISLTSLQGAWLLPLIPILLRLSFSILFNTSNEKEKYSNNINAGTTRYSPYKREIGSNMKRLLSYFIIMNIRGWFLYLFLNHAQQIILAMMNPDIDTDISESTQSCWYEELLRGHRSKQSCYGRSFDFSDHVVLFYSQLLPICLFETLFWFMVPPWKNRRMSSNFTQRFLLSPYYISEILVSITMILFLVFVYIRTYVAVYQTAAYFHTFYEIVMGYIISLCIQLPFAYIMCFDTWDTIREWIGISSHSSNMD